MLEFGNLKYHFQRKEHFLRLVLDKNFENKSEDWGGNRTFSQQEKKSKKKQFWKERPHDVEEWSQSQHDFVSGKLILSMLAQSFGRLTDFWGQYSDQKL